jgi:WD40 repeat protein
VAFSPDGKWLAASSLISGSSSGENEIRVWDVDSAEVVWVNPGFAVNRIEFASDGKTLVLQGVNAVRVWKIGDAEPLYSIQGVEKDLEISPDGNYLAYVTCEDNRKVNNHCVTETVQVVKILEAQFSYQFNGLTSEIQNLEFSNDGQSLAGASGNGIVIWSLTGDILHTLKVTDSRDKSQNLAFSPTQPVFISTDESGRMRIWNLETDSLERTISDAKIRELGFAPDGRFLVAISGDDINIWGIRGQQQ